MIKPTINTHTLKLNKVLSVLIFTLLVALLLAIPQININTYVQPTITSKLIVFLYG